MATERVADQVAGLSRIDRRCRCTGEKPRMVPRQPDVLAASGGLLIPTATSADQRDLEAEILLAVIGAGGARDSQVKPVINRVQPTTDGLRLEIDSDAIDSLLDVVLPVLRDGKVAGVPGLRPRQGRGFVDLHMLGSPASVRVHGISRARWRQAASQQDTQVVSLWRDSRDKMDRQEELAIQARGERPTGVMSGLLRRFLLFEGAAQVKATVSGPSVELEWIDGPRADVVAAVLTESDCRIPGVTLDGGSCLSLAQTLRLVAAAGVGDVAVQPEWAWAALRTDMSPVEGDNDLLDRGARPDPAIWDSDAMRAALARSDITRLFRLLRVLGVSKQELARRTGQSPACVSRILRGEQALSDLDIAAIASGMWMPEDVPKVLRNKEVRCI